MLRFLVLSQNQRCPQNSFDCGSNHCIDRSLICDGTVQCGQIDELFFSCLLLGLLMALCLYFKYHYRLNEKLLPSDIKPKLYGTLNDDHSSISSCNYLDDDEKGTINHYKFVKNSILNSIKFYE
ncbi:vitellogenin receptor-like protein [Sarcoptes scabiei]|uniref:Vitellogenin receptor-like protein n=1 Tax=Sarcoptes scabiei TaxID=52283 RepID=A0A131ZUN9_SARSC|nr:vitellogenin receptor-like protein [Sarcoptes scabiei]